jgi:hypothetical protein
MNFWRHRPFTTRLSGSRVRDTEFLRVVPTDLGHLLDDVFKSDFMARLHSDLLTETEEYSRNLYLKKIPPVFC